jgi:competence protein ComEC
MLEITIWDVNHGSAAHIKTPNNRHILVDLGDDGASFSPLRTLADSGVQNVDVVIITHPHSDHIDDIFNFYSLSPQVLYRPKHLSEDAIRKANCDADMPIVERYLEINRFYSGPVLPANDITRTANFGGATFDIFVPRNCDLSNINNHSVVLVASYAGLKMVIPGDNEAPSWNELLGDPNFLEVIKGADVLLASHHGRDAGYSSDLFTAMGHPKLIVISDGRFGDTSATDRYSKQAIGWPVFDWMGVSDTRKCVTTRKDGHITIRFEWATNDPRYLNYLNVTTSKVNSEF